MGSKTPQFDPGEPTGADPSPFTPALTWSALLGRWVDFARGALALPDDPAGVRGRDSVPDLIMLQAVFFALQQLDGLTTGERALGLDRAEVLIDRHSDALRQRWADQPLPAQVVQLIDDARRQLAAAAEPA